MTAVRAKSAVVALMLAIGIVMAIGPTRAATVRVGKAVPEAFSFAALDVGIKAGIFKKHGLDIQIFGFGGGAKLHQAMAADGIDIGIGTGPELAFLVKGSPEKAIAAMAGAPALMTLLVKANGPVKTIADLKGKRVAVSTPGSLTYWLATEFSRKQGWGPNGLAIAPLGQTKSQLFALRQGQIDGIMTDLTTALAEEKTGKGKIMVRFATVEKDFHNHVIYATDKFIAAHPDQVRAFLAAWFETIAYMHAHKAETVAIIKDVIGADADVTGRTYDELVPTGFFSDDGKFNPRALAVLGRSFVELKLLAAEPDTSKLITEAYLPGR